MPKPVCPFSPMIFCGSSANSCIDNIYRHIASLVSPSRNPLTIYDDSLPSLDKEVFFISANIHISDTNNTACFCCYQLMQMQNLFFAQFNHFANFANAGLNLFGILINISYNLHCKQIAG